MGLTGRLSPGPVDTLAGRLVKVAVGVAVPAAKGRDRVA